MYQYPIYVNPSIRISIASQEYSLAAGLTKVNYLVHSQYTTLVIKTHQQRVLQACGNWHSDGDVKEEIFSIHLDISQQIRWAIPFVHCFLNFLVRNVFNQVKINVNMALQQYMFGEQINKSNANSLLARVQT